MSQPSNTTPASPRIDSSTFEGVMWGGTVIATCLVVFRLWVRLKAFKKLFLDDYLVVLAWILMLAVSSIWQSQLPALYAQYGIASGTTIPTPEALANEQSLLRSEVPSVMFYYISLWLVKFSFLVFFRRLGHNVRGQKTWWWCVCVFTFLSLLAAIGLMGWNCTVRSLTYVFTQCASESAISYQYATLFAICALNVISDILILTIPILMLWNVRISLRRKLALIGIFSLTVIIMMVSIIRIAVVYHPLENADVSWLFLWSNIELYVALIVSCLASFRQLFVKATDLAASDPIRPSYESSSRRGWLASFRLARTRTKSMGTSASRFFRGSRDHRVWPSRSDSKDQILPMDSIYVDREIGQSVVRHNVPPVPKSLYVATATARTQG